MAGYCFVPNTFNVVDTNNTTAGSSVKYTAVKRTHLNRFYATKLLYGKSEGENYVIVNGGRYKLSGTKEVNQLEINSPTQQINAKFQCKSPIDIYGFSLESDSGVFVDNFSFRGNSGLPISKIKQSKQLKYFRYERNRNTKPRDGNFGIKARSNYRG
jgi:hypothetical protein